jgi:hypothetical protein
MYTNILASTVSDIIEFSRLIIGTILVLPSLCCREAVAREPARTYDVNHLHKDFVVRLVSGIISQLAIGAPRANRGVF